jgi:hypothetical protein
VAAVAAAAGPHTPEHAPLSPGRSPARACAGSRRSATMAATMAAAAAASAGGSPSRDGPLSARAALGAPPLPRAGGAGGSPLGRALQGLVDAGGVLETDPSGPAGSLANQPSPLVSRRSPGLVAPLSSARAAQEGAQHAAQDEPTLRLPHLLGGTGLLAAAAVMVGATTPDAKTGSAVGQSSTKVGFDLLRGFERLARTASTHA